MFWLFLFQFIVIPIGSSVAIMKRNDFFYQTKVLLDAIHMTDVIKLFFTGYYDQEKSKVIHNFSNVARYAKYSFFVLCINFIGTIDTSIHFVITLLLIGPKKKKSGQYL